MIDPLFWLGLSILLVAVSLTAVLVAAIPVLQELARAARSAEKLFDTLRRDLPPTLEALRLTGLEITDLADDVSDGVKSAGKVAKQVDESLDSAVKQAQKVEVRTRSVFTGVKAAWKSLTRPSNRSRFERLPAGKKRVMQLDVRTSASSAPAEGEAKRNNDNNYEASGQKTQGASAWQTDLEDLNRLDSEDF